MRNQNITQWADDLATTKERQARASLCIEYVGEQKEYCCLGLGSTLVPKMQIKQVGTGDLTPDGRSKFAFGRTGATSLAPYEFMVWLGYDEDDLIPFDAGEYDVYFDIPYSIKERSIDAQNNAAFDDDPSLDGSGVPLVNNSAASLNDDGFTFKQIADVIRYFGLSDEVR